MFMATA